MSAREQYQKAYQNWRLVMQQYRAIPLDQNARRESMWGILWDTHMSAYGWEIGYAAINSESYRTDQVYEGSNKQRFIRTRRKHDRAVKSAMPKPMLPQVAA